MLPIDGNPHRSMALIAHPRKVFNSQTTLNDRISTDSPHFFAICCKLVKAPK